jgi:hypothetical protein
MAAAPRLTELAGFLESGVILYLATRSADLEPESLMAFGVKIGVGDDLLTVYLAEAPAAATMANLKDNGQMALSAVRVTDYKSLQLKGEFVSSRPVNEADQAIQMRYLGLLGADLGRVGVPRSTGMRMIWTPGLALTMRVRDIFVQTPGRRAGFALEAVDAFITDRRSEGGA